MKPLYLLSFLCISVFCQAQKTETYKFRPVTLADVQKRIYSIDSNANAVVIADVGEAEAELKQVGNQIKSGTTIKRHRRVHLLKRASYTPGSDEATYVVYGKVEVKGATYNEENGKLVEYPITKENIFYEKTFENNYNTKFTMPNVKEGSIIDFTYTYYGGEFEYYFEPWEFQGFNPTLYSQFILTASDNLEFAFAKRGMHPLTAYYKNSSAGMTIHNWLMKDVPGLKQENYISSYRNFISMMEMHVTGVKFGTINTWPDLTKGLMNDPDFGEDLRRNNPWLKEIVQPLIGDVKDPLEKSKRIYDYVRDHIRCVSHRGVYLSQPLKEVLKTKKGSVSDINLLLAAMLNYASVPTTPIVLSTKNNGYVSTIYPMIARFNYVIAAADIAGKNYYLDASYPQLGFGRLLPDVYNGAARAINEEATSIEFVADSLKEREVSYIALTDTKGSWTGRMQKMPTYFDSYSLRNRIEDKGLKEFTQELIRDYSMEDAEIENLTIDSLKKFEHPLLIKYDLKVSNKADVIYLNPMFGEGYKDNPFKADNRLFPIEMPSAVDRTHIASIQVPEGYVVDELPKSVRVKLNDADEGGFEYIINSNENVISLTTRLYLKKATFLPQQYEDLREFFNFVVAKQKEQIVLKKKK
jgi:hypothetical protein